MYELSSEQIDFVAGGITSSQYSAMGAVLAVGAGCCVALALAPGAAAVCGGAAAVMGIGSAGMWLMSAM